MSAFLYVLFFHIAVSVMEVCYTVFSSIFIHAAWFWAYCNWTLFIQVNIFQKCAKTMCTLCLIQSDQKVSVHWKTQCIRTIPTQLMIWRWPSQNTFGMWTVLYWTWSSRTQFGISINVWRLAGDTLNITCNFLYCNHQVNRDFLITLYKMIHSHSLSQCTLVLTQQMTVCELVCAHRQRQYFPKPRYTIKLSPSIWQAWIIMKLSDIRLLLWFYVLDGSGL
jgi:hypothetical protein